MAKDGDCTASLGNLFQEWQEAKAYVHRAGEHLVTMGWDWQHSGQWRQLSSLATEW